MRLISAYLQLFRLDAAVISFATFLVGAELAGGITFLNMITAMCITGFSTNFCYSFNSWADWETDAVNKPGRPIPSGRVSPGWALAYSMFLLSGALSYPFFLTSNGAILGMLMLLPILGLLYSAKPFILKHRPPLSVFVVSAGLTIPIIVGYNMNAGPEAVNLKGFFISLFVFCLSIIPLKDIEDTTGDGDWNLYTRYGSRLPYYALAGLGVNGLLIFMTNVPVLLRIGLLLLFVLTGGCILWHMAHPTQMGRLYRRIIHMVEAGGALFLGWQVLYNKGVLSFSLLGGF